MNDHRFRDLLTHETAHLPVSSREAIGACLNLGRELARGADVSTRERAAIVAAALSVKLFTMLPDAPPAWVRDMIAKAACEAPAEGPGDANILATIAAAACARAA